MAFAERPIPVAGYLRRSTDRQDQSISDQRKAIEAFAAEHGMRIERIFTDDAISGASGHGRPAFMEMIAAAQARMRTFDRVLVYDITRFGRMDNDEAGYYRYLLRMHGVEVVYTNEPFRGDGSDDLLRSVKQWQAREESKDLARVTIRGLLSRAEGGFWIGGVPPYGYDLLYRRPEDLGGEFLFVLRFQTDGSKLVLDESGTTIRTLPQGERMEVSKRDRSHLVLSTAERVQVVKSIFAMSAEHDLTYRAIAGVLNRVGISSPRGPNWAAQYSGRWTLASIRCLMMNPVYVGDMVWNRRTLARFFKIAEGRAEERRPGPRRAIEHNPVSDWIRIPNAHPPIVSRRLFDTAQRTRRAAE